MSTTANKPNFSKYEFHSDGTVKNAETGKNVAPVKSPNGLKYNLTDDAGTRHSLLSSDLITELFPQPAAPAEAAGEAQTNEPMNTELDELTVPSPLAVPAGVTVAPIAPENDAELSVPVEKSQAQIEAEAIEAQIKEAKKRLADLRRTANVAAKNGAAQKEMTPEERAAAEKAEAEKAEKISTLEKQIGEDAKIVEEAQARVKAAKAELATLTGKKSKGTASTGVSRGPIARTDANVVSFVKRDINALTPETRNAASYKKIAETYNIRPLTVSRIADWGSHKGVEPAAADAVYTPAAQ